MYRKVYGFYYWNYGYYKGNLNTIEYSDKYFTLPDNMSEKDAFIVLSYLFKIVYFTLEYDDNDPQKIINCIDILNNLLGEYGFKEPTDFAGYEEHPIVSLYIVDDKYDCFNSTYHKNVYTKWYKPNVSNKKVLNIYNKLNIEYKDIDSLLKEVKQKQLKRIG